MPRIPRPPAYRFHKASRQAVVVIRGQSHYLGSWNSATSHAEYKRVIAEHWYPALIATSVSAGQAVDKPGAPLQTLDELILDYWTRRVQVHYVKDGGPTSEQDNIRQALRFVRLLYSGTLARDFGPLALKAVRRAMIDSGRSRKLINKDIHRIRGMFRWAAGEELYPGDSLTKLACVEGLEAGRSAARERLPVAPVAVSVVLTTLPHLSAQVAAMVRLQLLTAARPGEIAALRPRDVDCSDPASWLYRPGSHKTQHHGRDRVVVLGPRAQEVLRPWLDRDPADYCFSPAEVVASRRTSEPSAAKPPKKPGRMAARPKPGGKYTKDSYRVAIQRACRRAGVPAWTPHQLRHTCATVIRHAYDLEAAQIILGHSKPDTTLVYAERDMARAKLVMSRIG
jgi:integrase